MSEIINETEVSDSQIFHQNYDDNWRFKLARRSGMLIGHLRWMRRDVKAVIEYLNTLDDGRALGLAHDLQHDIELTSYMDEKS